MKYTISKDHETGNYLLIRISDSEVVYSSSDFDEVLDYATETLGIRESNII